MKEFQGFHSVIEKKDHPRGFPYLEKAYGEKTGGFDLDHSLFVGKLMKRFKNIASGLGIPIDNPLGLHITVNSHPGKVTLHETVPFMGPDVRSLIKENQMSQEMKRGIVEEVLKMQKKVWEVGWPISLDPPLANFCLHQETQRLYYIDRMPPRQRLADGSLLSELPFPPEESKKFIESRYFSPHQARVIYAQLIRDLPDLQPPIKEMMGEILGDEAYRLIHLDDDGMRKILASPSLDDIDLLRIMATERNIQGKIDAETTKHIYHLTHIKPGGILPPLSDLQETVNLLSQHVS